MSSRFQVKIYTEDSIRRYSFDKPPSWQAFIEHLSTHLFPRALPSSISFRVEYRDDENDTITLDSEEEWQEMIKQKPNQLVSLFLKSSPVISTVTELRYPLLPEKLVDLELKQSELLKQEEIKKQELDFRKKQELNKLEEELKKQEEIKRQVEEQKRTQKKLEEEEEELKKKVEEHLRLEELKKVEEKKKVEEEHRQLKEKLKMKEKEIREMEKLQQPGPQVSSSPKPIPKPLPKPTVGLNNNEYIKIYKDKLQKLWELGFTDVQRSLYLLMTFNGDVETVIEKLLSQ
jgi:hypothetical protein